MLDAIETITGSMTRVCTGGTTFLIDRDLVEDLGEVPASGGYRSRDANVLPMSDWVDTEMQKHHTAIQSLASTHGPSAGPVYVTGVLIGLNYSTQQTSDLNELSSRLKALLDSSKQG